MIYDSESGDFTIALTGDSMLTRRLSVFREQSYLALANLLRAADAAFTNLETTVRRWDEGAPGITQGTFMTTDPCLLEELSWAGIKIVSCANNHAFDYGEGGVLATIDHLDRAGLAHAGSGKNLAEARAPGYLDTPRGRLGLVAATATFRPWNRAGEQRPDVKGRPGINPLGFETVYSVDPSAFRELRRISSALGLDAGKERNRRHFYSSKEIPQEKENDIDFLRQRFVLSDRFSVSTRLNPRDLEENLRSIREARRQADWVLASLHCHEFGGESLLKARRRSELEEPADFVKTFAREALDAGADVFVGHGSHFPLGIEIYKGKPIFYSLGNFIFQNETVPFFPAEAYERFDLDSKATPADFLDVRTDGDRKGHPSEPAYWENVVAVCDFAGKKLREVRLYPIDQGHGRPRPQRGRPVMASAEVGARILDRLRRLCRLHGTELTIRDGVGVIRPESSTSER
ncbi:MAG TPA: CapA family protein [candidate division Zixibacteria bacterium]|nr:CapA family protein [candidate division Zixibacteria bacterium]